MPAKKSKSRFNFSRRLLIYLAVILGVTGLLYYFKNQFVVAWVNGRPIPRYAYVQELSKLAGNQAMDSLLTKELIKEEAAKQKVQVSEEELDKAMSQIEAKAKDQGTSLDALLAAQGVSRASVREEVRLQKLLEKLVGPVEVAEEKIKSYFDDNKTALYKDKTFDQVKDDVSEQLKQQELINKIQELIARLQSQAHVVQWLK